MKRHWIASLLLLAGLCVAGCGSSTHIPIHGEVKLDGQPVEGPGTIAFYPEDGTDSPSVSGEILNGKYEIPSEKGPSAGTFRVQITWPKKTGRQIPSVDPGMTAEETVEAIPARYNTNTELKAEISSAQNVHNFELTSK